MSLLGLLLADARHGQAFWWEPCHVFVLSLSLSYLCFCLCLCHVMSSRCKTLTTHSQHMFTFTNTQERNLGQNKFPRKVLMVFFWKNNGILEQFSKNDFPRIFFKTVIQYPIILVQKNH